MKCETCEGRGFTELEHGLIVVGCGVCNGTGEINDIDSRIGQSNSSDGSADTSQPKQPKKQKTKKRTRKGTG